MSKKVELDGEIIDRITVLGLTEHMNYLRKDIKNHKKDIKKVHPEDLTYAMDMVEHFKKVLQYYGNND